MTATLHLAVALDGAGWHPAAWRDPSARPTRAVHRRATGPTWPAPPSAACSTSLTIEDSFGLQSSRYARPDERTDQVRGRLDAVLIASLHRPADHAHRPRADGRHRRTPSRSTSPRRSPRSTTSAAVAPAGGRRCRCRPAEAAHVGRRAFPDVRSATVSDDGRRAALVARPVRRGGRRGRGRPPAVGQLGGRRRSSGRRHRPVHRPRQAALRRLRGPVLQRQGPVDRAPAAAGPAARRRPGPLAGAVRVRRPLRRRRVRHAGRHGTTCDRWVGRRPRRRATRRARTGAPLRVLRRPRRVPRRTTASAAARARQHLDDARRARRTAPTRPIFVGTPGELADLLLDWQAHGLDGFRLRPAVIGHDLDADRRRARARAAATRRVPHRRTTTACCASGSASRRPASRYADRRDQRASMSADEHAQADHPRRLLPRREQHHRVERPAVEEPDRVRVVRPPRPDRRARQARLLLPRRGAAPARAGRQDPRPRHRRPARHADRAHRARRRSPPTSAWPARSTPRSTSPTSWPASWPRSTTSPAAGRRGTWSRRPTRSPARTSAAAASSTTPTATSAPASSSQAARELWDSWARRRDRRRPGERARSCATASPGAFDHRGPQFDIHGHFNVPRSPQGHPVILQAGDSDGGRELAARDRRRDLQPAQHARRRRRRSTPTSRAGWPSTAASRDELKILPGVSFVLGDTPDGRGGAGPHRPPPAGQPADRDPAARAGVEPRPVGLRRRRSAARHRSGRVDDVDHPGPGPDAPRSAEDGRASGGRSPRRRT